MSLIDEINVLIDNSEQVANLEVTKEELVQIRDIMMIYNDIKEKRKKHPNCFYKTNLDISWKSCREMGCTENLKCIE